MTSGPASGESPDSHEITARTRVAVEAERARELAAARAARQRRRSPAGRAERALRWLRNRRTGPLPRIRRMARVVLLLTREPRSLPSFPAALLEAARLPRREASPTSVAPRSYAAEREAARRRLRYLSRAVAGVPGDDLVGLRLALIADERLAHDLAATCETVSVRPEDWRAVLGARPPHLLVVESAWRGNGGAWQYRIAWYAHPDALLLPDLTALLAWCAQHDVPSVFWDTCGGADVDRFRAAAARFDLILAPDDASAAWYAELPERRGAGVAVQARPAGRGAAREAVRAVARLTGLLDGGRDEGEAGGALVRSEVEA